MNEFFCTPIRHSKRRKFLNKFSKIQCFQNLIKKLFHKSSIFILVINEENNCIFGFWESKSNKFLSGLNENGILFKKTKNTMELYY
jgi:hypothetical protein